MIFLDGRTTEQRAMVLRKPEIPGEAPEYYVFGWPERLADLLLQWQGWSKDQRTPDEIAATLQALRDPAIDLAGYKLLDADRAIIAREAAWLLPMEDIIPYFPDISTDEYAIREWTARYVRDAGILHGLLDAMVEHDKDLDAPGLVAQIHRQIDEADE